MSGVPIPWVTDYSEDEVEKKGATQEEIIQDAQGFLPAALATKEY